MMPNSMPSGRRRGCADDERRRCGSRVTSVSPWPSSSTVQTSRMAARASRSTSRRRDGAEGLRRGIAARSCRASTAPRLLLAATASERGRSSSSSSSQAAASGMRSSRAPTKREPESTRVRRCAAPDESRSIRRNQYVVAERVAQPAEREQAVVGVGALGEPLSMSTGSRCALDGGAPATPRR